MTERASGPALLFNRTVDAAPVLELRGITKQFPGVLANDHIDFDLRRGEVHALLGENGAGKSTLMSILYGLYRPDEGQVVVQGEPVTIGSPRRRRASASCPTASAWRSTPARSSRTSRSASSSASRSSRPSTATRRSS